MIRARAAFFIGLFAIALVAQAAEYAPVTRRPVPIKVTAHGYYVQGEPGAASRANEGFNSNAGFVVTPQGVIVIDALGTRSLGHEFVRAIRQVTAAPIRRVIVTHYHADHVYGLQALKAEGAEIWAHRSATEYLEGEGAARLAQRRADLAPWVDQETRLVPPDRALDESTSFSFGGLTFDIIHMGPAHAPDDLVVVVREEGLIYSGDIMFTGRIPFVGNADSARWLETTARLLKLDPRVMVPGHGRVSREPARDLELTREYLVFLRQAMGRAVDELLSFEEAYAKTDWSRFSQLPAFEAANRINAYGTYLMLEREALKR